MGDAEMSRDILNLQKSETSDFIDTNIRTFGGKTSVLLPKEVRCFQFPVLPFWKPLRHSPQKKFCEKKPHFLHHMGKCPGYKGVFGCMIGCRMPFQGVGFPHFSCKTVPKNSKMIEETARFDSVFSPKQGKGSNSVHNGIPWCYIVNKSKQYTRNKIFRIIMGK